MMMMICYPDACFRIHVIAREEVIHIIYPQRGPIRRQVAVRVQWSELCETIVIETILVVMNCSAREVGVRHGDIKEGDDSTNLAKAIHPTMVTYPCHPLFTYLSIVGRAAWVMYYHRWCPTLYYMDGDFVRPAQGQNFKFTAPHARVAYRDAIPFKFLRGYDPGVV